MSYLSYILFVLDQLCLLYRWNANTIGRKENDIIWQMLNILLRQRVKLLQG